VLLKYQEDIAAMRGGGARGMLEEARVGGEAVIPSGARDLAGPSSNSG
jgi:hypothetical protein